MSEDEFAPDRVEAVARANCFAPWAHEAKNGELVLKRGCDCKSPDDCYEINGPLREEMLTQARYGMEADAAWLAKHRDRKP